ncbi:MAG: carboxypeptidase-like regulatory domain-containing protein [Terriglobia bacterium]|jgi:hypothetical protein
MGNGDSASTPASNPSPAQSLSSATSDSATQSAAGDAGSSVVTCGTPADAPAGQPAPAAQKAHLVVQVKDCSGKAVQGVNVAVSGKGWNGVTDASGKFDFGDENPDTYTVTGLLTATSTPASQTLAAPAGQTTQYNLVICNITIEIQINNTGTANDDIVQVKCAHPAHRHKVPCQIKIASGAAHDHQITLGNPDGRLRFPESGDTTKNVTLPAAGTWVAFEISGENASNAIGDAVIQATLGAACPDGGAGNVGDVKGSKPATVFWFDAADIKMTPGGNYVISGNLYTPNAGHAIDHSAKATIKPAGVDCSTPQVKDLRVGIMQLALQGVQRTMTWSNPTIAWVAGTAAGTSTTVPASIVFKRNHPVNANDSAGAVDPLYDQPGHPHVTIDANSVQVPGGCAGGGAAATSSDTPSGGAAPATVNLPASTAAGVNVGTVTYTLTSTKIDLDFLVWAVIFNKSTNQFCAVRERSWNLHADSAAAGDQKAKTDAADRAPTTDPVGGQPFSNDVLNDPANKSTTQVGSTVFTK